MIKNLKKVSTLVFVFVIFAIVLTTVKAASTTVYFNNGGRAALIVNTTNVSGTAYHGDHYDWPCRSTLNITMRSGSIIKVGPVDGIGTALAYRNNLYYVAGAQGIFMINGEQKFVVLPAG